jgi:hypothetical protein
MSVGADDQVSFQAFAACQFGNGAIAQGADPFTACPETDGPRVQPAGQVLQEFTSRDGDGIDTDLAVELCHIHPSNTRPLGGQGLEPIDHLAVTVELNSQSP